MHKIEVKEGGGSYWQWLTFIHNMAFRNLRSNLAVNNFGLKETESQGYILFYSPK